MKAGASSGGSSGGVAVVAAAAAAVAAAAGAVLLTMSLRKRQRVTGCGERTKWAKGGERVWVVGNSTDGENIATPAQFCKAPIEPGSVDVIVVEDAASLLDENVLRALAKTLRGGGRAVVMGGDPRVVSSTLTLNGLKDCQPTSDGQAVVGYKPEWDVGTKALLKIPSARMPSSAPVAAAWKVNVTELAEDDLVDEDDLLNQSEAPPIRQNAGNGGGCDTKRRACKDCTCGRAEKEQAGIFEEEDPADFKSGCGNCSKGDAFRCASCPFLGKPAFEKGQERLVLSNLTDATAF